MTDIKKKIAEVAEKDKSKWLEKAKYRRENRNWLLKSKRIALRVLGVLKERGMQQKELAEQLGVSPQQVSKIVKGKENLTLETISKLESVLEINLIEVNSAKVDSATKNKSTTQSPIETLFEATIPVVKSHFKEASSKKPGFLSQDAFSTIMDELEEFGQAKSNVYYSFKIESDQGQSVFTNKDELDASFKKQIDEMLRFDLNWKKTERQKWEEPSEPKSKLRLVG